ncbi:Golgi apparatus membrane protein TVP38 [Amylocystis lapponica]|nr:Golgi apparatus membrane protein TVP38 [Amylocystis lapponica]
MAIEGSTRLAWLLSVLRHYVGAAFYRYRKLSFSSKAIIWATATFYATVGTIVLVIGGDRIGQALYDLAQKISHLRYGQLVILGLMTLESFPPFIGHTTTITLCGYAYGMHGFWLNAFGSLFGSAFAFVVLRLLFVKRLRRWAASNEKWQALQTVVAAKGLPLITLIRASPLPPWPYSNTLFASIETVALWQFFLATFVVFPKIALFTFIGSRLAALSDGEQRKQMDTSTKILNVAVSVGGLFVSVVASMIIYRAMKAEIHRQGVPPETDELAVEALEDAEEGAPLLGAYA